MEKQTRVDGRCVKEYFKGQTIVWLIILCAGFSYCAIYTVVSIIKGNWNSPGFGIAIFFGILVLVFSIVYFVRIHKAIKMANDHAFDACYEFNDDHFFRKTKMKEEQISESKINYSDIVCYKISKNYIYLVLFNKSYYPVDRDNSLEEFLTSKNIARK